MVNAELRMKEIMKDRILYPTRIIHQRSKDMGITMQANNQALEQLLPNHTNKERDNFGTAQKTGLKKATRLINGFLSETVQNFNKMRARHVATCTHRR